EPDTVAQFVDVASDTPGRSPFDRPTTETAASSESAARAYAIPVTSRNGESVPGKTPRFRFGQRSAAAQTGERIAADEATASYDRDVVMFPTRDQAAAHGRGGAEGSTFFLT